jgi:predicted DsbA family dithiol-disulfide isomerase
VALARATWLERRYGARVQWVPFDLHPEYPPEGIPRRELHQRYGPEATRHMQAMIEDAGFPFAPSAIVPSSTRALELAELARGRGRFEEVHRALFSAYWSQGRNIGDPETLVEIGTSAGLDLAEIRTVIEELPHQEQIKAATSGALDLGIGGVPAWVIDQRLFVSGAQPYEVFERAMERLGHRPIEPAEP